MIHCIQILDKLDRLDKKNDNIYGHSYVIIDDDFLFVMWVMSILILGYLLIL